MVLLEGGSLRQKDGHEGFGPILRDLRNQQDIALVAGKAMLDHIRRDQDQGTLNLD